jgi:hypothetical protein
LALYEKKAKKVSIECDDKTKSTILVCCGLMFDAMIAASVGTYRPSYIYLPVDFKLSDNDVYCGRGAENEGNHQFRKIIVDYLKPYCQATVCAEKTSNINQIMSRVQTICMESGCGVGFVGKDHKFQRYYEVENGKAVRSSTNFFSCFHS